MPRLSYTPTADFPTRARMHREHADRLMDMSADLSDCAVDCRLPDDGPVVALSVFFYAAAISHLTAAHRLASYSGPSAESLAVAYWRPRLHALYTRSTIGS